MVKVITEKGRNGAAHVQFNHIRQVAPMCTCFSETTQVHTPNSISIGSAVFAQLTAQSRYSLQWAAPSPLPLKITPSYGGSDSHMIHGSLGPSESTTDQFPSLLQAMSVAMSNDAAQLERYHSLDNRHSSLTRRTTDIESTRHTVKGMIHE